uniref:CCR4-NOT transcription complex subunit 11 n=1 Tax=Ciona savignyi TaxID=51511 RepID=H2YS72_CIOSA
KMSLSLKELSNLLGFLQEEEIANQQFESFSPALQRAGFNKQDHFRVASSVVLLLQHKDLLTGQHQRLAAMYLLYDMYKNEPVAANPFAPVFTHLLQPSGQDEHIIYNHCQSQLPASDKAGISCVISNPDAFDISSITCKSKSKQKVIESLLTGSNAPTIQNLRPEFIRPAPPLHPCADEMVWMNPIDYSWLNFTWDTSMGQNINTGVEVKRLMAKAFKNPLTVPQQNQLLQELNNDQKLVYHVGLTPTKLPDLVENNPLVAIEVLLMLMQSSQITEYFTVLVNMEMSLHSMEVLAV